MPTYEYRCTACEEHLEVVQSFSDDALTECPNCGGQLRKVFSPVGIVFKGSGFYKTDSRGGKGGSLKPKEKESKGEKEPKETGSKDTAGKEKESSSASSSPPPSKYKSPSGSSSDGSNSKKDSKIA